MAFDKIVIEAWSLERHAKAVEQKSVENKVLKGIVNAPFANPPRVRCFNCGNKVIPSKFSVEALYCPCCNAVIENAFVEDLVEVVIDVEARARQLGIQLI